MSSAQVLTEWLWSQNPEHGCEQSDGGSVVPSAAVPLISTVLTRGHRARVQNTGHRLVHSDSGSGH